MKAQVTLAALALLAASQVLAQSAPAAGGYDWGQSQVRKSYESPYARPSEALTSTLERKRLTEARSGGDDKAAGEEKRGTTGLRKAGDSGKLACLGMGSTIGGTTCHEMTGQPGLTLRGKH